MRLLLRLVGCFLIVLAFFLYEDEEGNIQYRFDVWDKALKARGAIAHSAVAAFVGGVAGLTSRFFDRLFGKNLLTFRFLGVSACYSLASIFLLGGIAGPLAHAIGGNAAVQYAPLTSWIWFIIFAAIGSVPAIVDKQHKEALLLWGLGVFGLFAVPIFEAAEFARTMYGAPQALRVILIVGIVLVFSFIFDILFVTLVRWSLRQASAATDPIRTIALIAMNVAFLAGC